MVVGLIGLFWCSNPLVFVFAGIGIIVLGFFVFVGMILGLAFRFVLSLPIPSAILWGFVAMTRKTNTS
jgi:uncharacterized protein (DUF983 family)